MLSITQSTCRLFMRRGYAPQPLQSTATRYHSTSSNKAKRNKNIVVTTYSKSAAREDFTPSLRKYVDALKEPASNLTLVLSTGPAGTGKTMMACTVGMEKIAFKEYERMVITRPTIPVGGEHLGFLPGTLDEKISPWLSHMVEYIDKYQLKSIMKKVDLLPLSYIRGHTFDNTWIIADEMQNSTVMQMKTLLTRVGKNTKIVITGDLSQSDLENPEENGLLDLMTRLRENNQSQDDLRLDYAHCEFQIEDVKRSEFVKRVILLYDI